MNSRVVVLVNILISSFVHIAFAQVSVEGYAFETGNRGYLNQVVVTAYTQDGQTIESMTTEKDGFFTLSLPKVGKYKIIADKDFFEPKTIDLDAVEDKNFLKIELKREPGYVFEVTLAESRSNENIIASQIKGALIEVYNNTTKESEMVLEDYQEPEFRLNLLKGNHYTILIRKKGYFAKRMEAYVNVKGCILCFEGVGQVEPGVTDNLTENNQNGVLLANVEMDSIFRGKKLAINNLYYDLAKWDIKPEAELELDKVITMMNDNPHLSIELGSHTDSRGSSKSNKILSEKRARSAVNYLRTRGPISSSRIVSKGYGEDEITNGCVDGVDCSEEQHAVNRRTELKIIGIEEDGSIKKTLAQMKQEEFMDELLAEIENEGIMQVSADGDTTMVKQPAIKTTQIDSTQGNIEVEEVDDSGMDNFRGARDKQKQVEEQIQVADFELLNGYKLVIVDQDTPLANDSPLWQKHKDLQVHFDGKMFRYVIGRFTNKKDCQSFYNSAVKLEYPDAYILQFKDNKIVK